MSDQPAIDRSTQEFYDARKAARQSRKAFAASPDSAFVTAMQGAISQYLQARDQGVSRDDGIRGLEMELRGCWPKTVSKFAPACIACDDTGWVEYECIDGGRRCGRELCAQVRERAHLYVEPCGCAKGKRTQPKPADHGDIANAAGKTAKRRQGFVRFGR